MDLSELLLSKFDRCKLVIQINEDHDLFEEVMKISLTSQSPQNWRGTWVLNHATSKKDDRINPHIDAILDLLAKAEDGHQRELIKLVASGNYDEDQEGRIFDVSINIWEKVAKISSTRYKAIHLALDIAIKYPDLLTDLKYLAADHYLESLSLAVRKSVSKRLKLVLGDS